MANIASNLYSEARGAASQGKTVLERIRNKWNADIALMEKIGKITGNTNWAQAAQSRLAEFERNLAMEKATADSEVQRIADVTFGGNTPSLLDDKYAGMRMREVMNKVDDSVNGLLDGYSNAKENLANATDFRKVSAADQAKIMASADIKALQSKVAQYENEIGKFQEQSGLTLDVPVLTRDSRGNYQAMSEGERNRTTGRLGEGVKARQTADGSWEVYGASSGDVKQQGFADASAAEKWMNMQQSGGSADATGAFAPAAASGDSVPVTGDGGTTTTGDTGTTTTDGDATATTTTTTTSGNVVMGVEDYKARLTALGIDITGLTDAQIQTLGMMNQIVDTNAQNDKATAPRSISPDDWASFLSQASSEMDPYFQEQFNMARQDLTQAMGYYTGEFAYQEQVQKRQFEEQRLAQDEAAAEQGIARSGIRNRAEALLKEQQVGSVSSGRRAMQNTLYGLGSTFEREFGSPGLAKAGVPMFASLGDQALGTPNVQLGYMPLGNIQYGVQGRQYKTDTTTRAQELAGQETENRYNLAYGTETV